MRMSRLNSSPLWWPATVMGYGRDVSDCPYFQSCSLQRPNSRIPPGSRPFDINFQCPHSGFTRPVRRGQCSLLCGEWGAFSRTFEAERSRARPAHDVTFHVRDRDRGVVERRLDMRNTRRNDLLFFFLCTLFLGLSHVPFSYYVLAVAFLRTAIAPRRGPLRVRALVCVRWPRTGSPRRCRNPRYAPTSISRLILNEISFRRSPSTLYCRSEDRRAGNMYRRGWQR